MTLTGGCGAEVVDWGAGGASGPLPPALYLGSQAPWASGGVSDPSSLRPRKAPAQTAWHAGVQRPLGSQTLLIGYLGKLRQGILLAPNAPDFTGAHDDRKGANQSLWGGDSRASVSGPCL